MGTLHMTILAEAAEVITSERLLLAGLTIVAGVVVKLWTMVLDHNKKCEDENKRLAEENAKIAARTLLLERSLGLLTGAASNCSVSGCALVRSRLLDEWRNALPKNQQIGEGGQV